MGNRSDNRYYWQRNRTTGVYQIKDRFLAGESVASCNYKEQAELVSAALNHLHQHKQVNVVTTHDKPSTKPVATGPSPISDSYDFENRRFNRPA